MNLYSKYNKSLNIKDDGVLKIGHMMWNPDHYPKSAKMIKEWTAHDIHDLMTTSFDKYNFTWIELDVQLFPKWNWIVGNDVIITHDVLKWKDVDDNVREYFEKNNFRSLLDNYIEKWYFRDKTMFIELKEGVWMSEKYKQELREKTAKVLEDTLNKHNLSSEDEDLFKSHIGFLSFWLDNLDNMQELIKEKDSYTYHFIASTDKWIWHVVHQIPAFSYIRCINDKFIEKLKSSDWLDWIWLDPIWIKNTWEFMKKFDNRVGGDPMKFYVSTYKLPQDKFLERIKKENVSDENIWWMIFDVKEA